MKIIHHDGERLVLEITSGRIVVRWVTFIILGMIWLGIGGGIIAQTRSIRCEKIEPTVVNCQIIDSFLWGAIQRVKMVNGVRRVFVDEEIGYSDASQYPIYRVFLEIDGRKEVPFTDWERSLQFTNQVKNSLQRFLNSEAITYNLDLNSPRNVWGAIFSLGLITLNLLSLSASPYQIRLIVNQALHQVLIIQKFVFFTRKEILALNSVSLIYKEDKDSDDDSYYTIILAASGIKGRQYMLKSSYKRQEIEDYWRFNPDMQLLKQFVRSEEIFPEQANSGGE